MSKELAMIHAFLKKAKATNKTIFGPTLLLLVGSVFAGHALASIPSNGGVFYGCVKADGTLIVKDDNGTGDIMCGAQATKIQWNQSGPQGPQGPAGPGSGSVLATQKVLKFGDILQGGMPVKVLDMPEFGTLEATLCDANGGERYQLHNTTDHNVLVNYTDTLAPGDTQNIFISSPTLSEGSGSSFRIGSSNFSAYTSNQQCVFEAQIIINTDAQVN